MLLLAGTEELSFELTGSATPIAVSAHVPSGIEVWQVGGAARVALTVFRMRGLRLRGQPGPGFDYSEALWRVAVRHEDQLAWLAVACDLDSALVRGMGRALIRYPVRVGAFALAADGFSVRAVGAVLAVGLGGEVAHDVESPGARPLLVVSGGRLWRVPWAEVAGPEARVREASVNADTLSALTLGGVSWDRAALCVRGRGHRCGRARPVARQRG